MLSGACKFTGAQQGGWQKTEASALGVHVCALQIGMCNPSVIIVGILQQ
jgi:hypothetical protein